jgi:hypothetical protein
MGDVRSEHSAFLPPGRKLCHALITRDCEHIPEQHFELVGWTVGRGLHRENCVISQIAI